MSESFEMISLLPKRPLLKLADGFTENMTRIQEEEFLKGCYNILDCLDEYDPEMQLGKVFKMILRLRYGDQKLSFSSRFPLRVARKFVDVATVLRKFDLNEVLLLVDLKLADLKTSRLFELNFCPTKPEMEIVVTIHEKMSILDRFSFLPTFMRRWLLARRSTIDIEGEVYFAKYYKAEEEKIEVLENVMKYAWYNLIPEVYKIK